MSVKVMSYVWEHSEHKSTRLLAMLALADHANDDGEAWPGTSRIAKKIRTGQRNSQKTLRTLDDFGRGEILIEEFAGAETSTGNTNKYHFISYMRDVLGQDVTPLIRRVIKARLRRHWEAQFPSRGELQDTPQDARGVETDTLGVSVRSPLGVSKRTPKPSVVTVSKPSVKDSASSKADAPQKDDTPKGDGITTSPNTGKVLTPYELIKNAIVRTMYNADPFDSEFWTRINGQKGAIDKAAKELLKGQYTPDDVPIIYRWFKAKHPDITTFTAGILPKWAYNATTEHKRNQQTRATASAPAKLEVPEDRLTAEQLQQRRAEYQSQAVQ